MKKNIAIITLSILLCISVIFSIVSYVNNNNLKEEKVVISNNITDLTMKYDQLRSDYDKVAKEKDDNLALYIESSTKCSLLEYYYTNTIVKTAMNTAYFKVYGKDLESYLPYGYDESIPMYPSDIYEKYYKDGMTAVDVLGIDFE